MSENHLKTQSNAAIQAFVKGRTDDSQLSSGKSYPCSVTKVISSGIVQVKFEVNSTPFTLPEMKVPVVGSEYIRYPIQVGDLGRCVPSDVRLGGVSGLATTRSPPDLTPAGNLSALAFEWLGSSNWEAATDPNALELIGPNGVILRDKESNAKLTLSPSGVTIDGDSGDLTVTGNLSAGNGWTGSFTTPTGQTVTVQNGIITNVV